MSFAPVPRSTDRPAVISATSGALWLTGALMLSLVLYYFIGIDQGATSLFGNDTHIHEFVHDARHYLGFPCH